MWQSGEHGVTVIKPGDYYVRDECRCHVASDLTDDEGVGSTYLSD